MAHNNTCMRFTRSGFTILDILLESPAWQMLSGLAVRLDIISVKLLHQNSKKLRKNKYISRCATGRYVHYHSIWLLLVNLFCLKGLLTTNEGNDRIVGNQRFSVRKSNCRACCRWGDFFVAHSHGLPETVFIYTLGVQRRQYLYSGILAKFLKIPLLASPPDSSRTWINFIGSIG